MGIHINFVCDHNDCKHDNKPITYQSLLFDQLNETWGSMINYVRDLGWYVELNDGKVVRSLCPKHK